MLYLQYFHKEILGGSLLLLIGSNMGLPALTLHFNQLITVYHLEFVVNIILLK